MAQAIEGFKFFQPKTPLPTSGGINYYTVVVRGVIFDENSPGYKNSLDIGSILFNTPTELATTEDEQLFKLKARPLFSNITQYPLINELVVVLGLPSIQTQNEGDSVNLYYFPPVSLWNNAYANYFKAKGLSPTTELTNFSNELVNQGVPNKTNRATIQSTPPSLPEDKKVYNSLQRKGDVTYEGRFGNLIKFTSTHSPEYSPLTIIKNGNPDNVFSSSPRIPENINQDKSSIYLTDSGSINIDTGARNNISYLTSEKIPENVSQYSKDQVIINSGRILLNSKNDHTIIYGHKSINLNSLGTINIQSNNEVVIIGKELYLNSNNKSEPIILGESLFQVLDLLLQQLEFFSSAVSTSVSTPVGTPLGPMNTTALQLNTTIQQLREILPDIKSKTTFTN